MVYKIKGRTGQQNGQISMLVPDKEERIPANHLLRQINQMFLFDIIYAPAAPYDPANDHPPGGCDLLSGTAGCGATG